MRPSDAPPTGEVVADGQFPAAAAGPVRAVVTVVRRTGGALEALRVIEKPVRSGSTDDPLPEHRAVGFGRIRDRLPGDLACRNLIAVPAFLD